MPRPTPAFVETPFGLLRGESVTKTNRPCRRFLAIPFAHPPVGERRWKPPVPLEDGWKWEGERDATKFAPSCPQHNSFSINPFQKDDSSEDCLYLNVYAPPEEDIPTGRLPVLIFIHGGFLQFGSAKSPLFDATNLVSEFGRIIVVTIQYRLNVFGFLAAKELFETTNDVAGNFGLLDQKAAVEWVHKHISSFGGDSTRITLWGQSAGATSVHYQLHLLPPGLIRRAIISSGAIISPPPLRSARPLFEKLCTALGVEPGKDDTMERLRAVKTEVLLKAGIEVKEFWEPVVDGVTFKEGFGEKVENNNWNAAGVDAVLVGAMKDESILYSGANPIYDLVGKFYRNITLTDKVLSPIYPRDSYPGDYIRTAYIISDGRYQATASRLLSALVSDPTRRVYHYRFYRVPPVLATIVGLIVRFVNKSLWKPWTWFSSIYGAGAFHGGDLFYLFYKTGVLWGRKEKALAKKLAGLMITFVENGEMDSGWERVGAEGEARNNVLILKEDGEVRMEREVFRAKEIRWWNKQKEEEKPEEL